MFTPSPGPQRSTWRLNVTRPTNDIMRTGHHLEALATHLQPTTGHAKDSAQCLLGHPAAGHWQTPLEPRLGLLLLSWFFTL